VVRLLRSFDGVATWDPALGLTGKAGDFDGDGVVDVGGPSTPIHASGGSLGGITDALAAGVEPALESVISLVPGGMLSEIGARSALGGVKTAMILREVGPLFYSTGGTSTTLMIAVNQAEGNETDVAVHALDALKPKDTVVLSNLRNQEYRCGVVQPDGAFRVAVPSDKGDPLEFRAYRGPLPAVERIGCDVPATATPLVVINTVDRDVAVGDATIASGGALAALSDGYGLRRSTPELRRFLGLGQIALDPADPMNFAPYWEGHRTLTYGNGETVASQVVLMPSIGDPGVCVANGLALSRAAGFTPYDVIDPAYGKSPNQVLLDTFSIEGVSRLKRFTDAGGAGVLEDISNLSAITGANDGWDVPRLVPPMRSTHTNTQGASGTLLVMLSPQGKHGFVIPDPGKPFDYGTLLFNIIARHQASSGKDLSYDACQIDDSCSWIAPVLP
jgi:hypothetical protein